MYIGFRTLPPLGGGSGRVYMRIPIKKTLGVLRPLNYDEFRGWSGVAAFSAPYDFGMNSGGRSMMLAPENPVIFSVGTDLFCPSPAIPIATRAYGV